MIIVSDSDKARIAQSGANKLFGIDYKTRKGMSRDQLLELFNEAWQNRLQYLVESAEVIIKEEVDRRLLDKYHPFIDSTQEHRSFHYLKAEFIAQLHSVNSEQYQLTQLWRVSSSDTHPNTLFITFSDADERTQFSELARKLKKQEEDLALKLIRNFMDVTNCLDEDKESNSTETKNLYDDIPF